MIYSRLERTGCKSADELGHVERLGLGKSSRLSNLTNRTKDCLQKVGRRGSSGGRGVDMEERTANSRKLSLLVGMVVVVSVGCALADHLDKAVSLDLGSRASRVTSASTSSILDIDKDTNNSNLGILTLPNHVHLHSHALSGVEMLAGQVEVELLESEAGVAESHAALSGDDLDGSAKVLELGSFGHVGDLKVKLRGRDHGVGAGDHVDGGLVDTGRADSVGCGIESNPVGWALLPVSIPCQSLSQFNSRSFQCNQRC